MLENPDDLTPAQLGKEPSAQTQQDRARRELTGRGRRGRLRSWLTILVGLAAVLLCALILLQVGP